MKKSTHILLKSEFPWKFKFPEALEFYFIYFHKFSCYFRTERPQK